jgi:hypothetical protein
MSDVLSLTEIELELGPDDLPTLHVLIWRYQARAGSRRKRAEQDDALMFVHTLMNSPMPSHRPGKPDQHHQLAHSQARPDHPALAVRPRRGQGNVSVAEEPAQAGPDEHCRGAPTTGALRIARS